MGYTYDGLDQKTRVSFVSVLAEFRTVDLFLGVSLIVRWNLTWIS